jgi:hypothetical protein
MTEILTISDSWTIEFDSFWGGPAQQVIFQNLEDWTTRPEPGIKYYSGTAIYKTSFDLFSKTS